MPTPAPRAVDAWVFRVSLCGLQLEKMVFKFTKNRRSTSDGSDTSDTSDQLPGAGSEWA
jgi:hypothetical protein